MATPTLTTAQLSQITGTPLSTLHGLMAMRQTPPPAQPGRPCHPARWTLPQALGLLIGRGLRKHGVSVPECRRAMAAVWHENDEQLDAAFTDGRRFLAVCGGQVLPRLVTWEAVFENPDAPARDIAAAGAVLSAVNVEILWRQLLLAVGQLQAEGKKERVNR